LKRVKRKNVGEGEKYRTTMSSGKKMKENKGTFLSTKGRVQGGATTNEGRCVDKQRRGKKKGDHEDT